MPNEIGFDRYIGLGDSISGDFFPGKTKGAASQLYSNSPITPEFRGNDLLTVNPDCRFYDETIDGNTSGNLLRLIDSILPPERSGKTLVTLTIGGNDLVLGLMNRSEPNNLGIDQTEDNIYRIVDKLQSQYLDLTLVVGTIYDPDNNISGLIVPDGVSDSINEFNSRIKAIGDTSEILIGDIYQHFITNSDATWYIYPYEPSAIGASEIRRVFLESLQTNHK